MIHPYIRSEEAVPIWAAIGAPLVGVPLMVVLLALSVPTEKAPQAEPESGFQTEQVESHGVEWTAADQADCEGLPPSRG